MYFNNQESDDDDDDDNSEEANASSPHDEHKALIDAQYKRFLGLPKLDLDGAECSNDEDEDEG
jgi:hypothetical protein